MKILALESSATACSVSLVRDGELVAQNYQNSGLTHSRTLMPMVDSLLENCGEKLDDVDVIRMDYAGRFTVEMPDGADYEYKLRFLREAINGGKIQDNMTGTFDMMREDDRTYLEQYVR